MKAALAFLAWIFITCHIALGQDPVKQIPKDTTVTILPAHKIPLKPEHRWGDAGVGFGIDYGGLVGAKVTFYPIPFMGIFAAGGWEFVGIGWNVGCLGRLIPANGTHSARPYFKVMYGVNAATTVSGISRYDKMFYGVTVGFGIETRFGKFKKGGINIDLNLPFRSPDYFDMVNRMKNDPMVKMTSSTIPITLSIGYNVEF